MMSLFFNSFRAVVLNRGFPIFSFVKRGRKYMCHYLELTVIFKILIRKEKDVPERKRRCLESGKSLIKFSTDSSGARFRIPKMSKRKMAKLRHKSQFHPT